MVRASNVIIVLFLGRWADGSLKIYLASLFDIGWWCGRKAGDMLAFKYAKLKSG